MNFYDVFRGFFGFPGERRPRDPFFGGITRDDDDDDDDEDGDDAQGSSFGADHFGFTFEPGEMRLFGNFGFDDVFRDFNNLFSEMGAMGLPPQPFGLPGIEAPPPPAGQKRQTLRDSMLKHPESHGPSRRDLEDDLGPPPVPERKPWRPFRGVGEMPLPPVDSPKEDGDLDSRVTSEGLETILPPAQPRSYFKSVSITKVMAPDGTVEERRTVRDSQGHEETVVTRRSAGEPSPGLDGRWKGETGSLMPFQPPHQEELSIFFSILDRLFGRWFSGR